MAVYITYFVHGTTLDNEKEISSGWSDVELSELGMKQALELKETLKRKKFDAVFPSDLKRAVTTAEIIWGEDVPIVPDERLRECNYGDMNGKSSSIVEPLQPERIFQRFPDGENYEDVKERISDFLLFLKHNYDGKHIAIVGHKAPQIALDVLLRKQSWEEAFANDWRKTKSWQPGWEYVLE